MNLLVYKMTVYIIDKRYTVLSYYECPVQNKENFNYVQMLSFLLLLGDIRIHVAKDFKESPLDAEQ